MAEDHSFDFSDNLLDIDAVDDAHIWAVGENGTIVFFGYDPGTANSLFENQEFPLVHVFPNPATDRVTLSTETGSIKEVEFINILGQTILKKEFGSATAATINVSGLKHGLYLLRIKTQQDLVFSKIVVE
jgi:endo-1,4-beta-mannosidase